MRVGAARSCGALRGLVERLGYAPSDLAQVARICAATPAPDPRVGEPARNIGDLMAQFLGVAILQMPKLAERDFVFGRRIRHDAAQTARPARFVQRRSEFQRMSAVYEVIRRAGLGRGVSW